MKVIVREGTLQTYFETGMEHLGFHLYLNDEKYKTPNSQYVEGDPKTGPPFYQSWDGTIVLNKLDVVEITDKKSKYNGKRFTLGNLELARKDGFRFGVAYPFEEIPLLDWYELFATEKISAKVYRPLKKIAYYGGTFDPIHSDHKKIIQDLTYQFDLVLVMPGNNWTKQNKPIFSIKERIDSVKAVCDQWNNVEVLAWARKKSVDTSSTYKVAEEIKNTFGIYPHIVIGSDNVKNVEKWKFWDKLKSIPFVIFHRIDKLSEQDLAKFEKPIYWSQFRSENINSTAIRSENKIEHIPKEAQKYLNLNKLSQKKTDKIKI